jgi:hypothetical protein
MTTHQDAVPDAGVLTRPVSARLFAVLTLLSALAVLAILFFMPDDPYSRYKAVSSTDYIKAGWIYERLHFDPTPVDIAFIGTSRTMQGVDSAAIETALNARSDRKYHVVNLALPSLGRDVSYLTGRMLLETKKPSLVFVEIDYLNQRPGSPIFSQLATPQDVLAAPLLNQGLLKDVLGISARHARLAWRSLIYGRDSFDPTAYRGQHWDDDYQTTGANGRVSPPRLEFMEKQRFEREAVEWVGNEQRKVRQYDWVWPEFAYNEAYEDRLLELVRQSGARIVLLYLTAVGSPERPFRFAKLSQYGELWPIPPQLTSDNQLWVNPTHFNYNGARPFSAWIADRLATDMQAPAALAHP